MIVLCKKKEKQKPKPKKDTQMKKGAISFQNELFLRTFLNCTWLAKFFLDAQSGLQKKERLRKTKVHVRPKNKQKNCFLLFITYIGLAAFIFIVFLSYDSEADLGLMQHPRCSAL